MQCVEGTRVRKKNCDSNCIVITVTDLDYADDLLLLTKRTDQAQKRLSRLDQESGKAGLYCNAKKTELQVFN